MKTPAKSTTTLKPDKPQRTTSLLLIFDQQQNQLREALNYLQHHQHIDQTAPLTNLNIIIQDGLGLKIKTVRALITTSHYSSYDAQIQVNLILSADQGSLPAQNALLKILEEPPNNQLIVLTSSQPQLLLPTIHSRCQLINLAKPNPQPTVSSSVLDTADQLLSPNFEFSQALKLAEKPVKREEAEVFLADLLFYLHSFLSQTTSKKFNQKLTITILKILLEGYQDLQKNLNVKLVLEHCYFQIAQLHSLKKNQ